MVDPVIMLHIAFGGSVAGTMLAGIFLWHREWGWLLVTVPGILLGLSLGLLLAVPLLDMGRGVRSLPAMAISAVIWLPPTLFIYRKIKQKFPLTSN